MQETGFPLLLDHQGELFEVYGEGLTGDLSKIDCDALWRGTKTLAGKNYLLPDGAVAGICVRRDCLPTQIRFISLEILKDFLETKSKVNVK